MNTRNSASLSGPRPGVLSDDKVLETVRQDLARRRALRHVRERARLHDSRADAWLMRLKSWTRVGWALPAAGVCLLCIVSLGFGIRAKQQARTVIAEKQRTLAIAAKIDSNRLATIIALEAEKKQISRAADEIRKQQQAVIAAQEQKNKLLAASLEREKANKGKQLSRIATIEADNRRLLTASAEQKKAHIDAMKQLKTAKQSISF